MTDRATTSSPSTTTAPSRIETRCSARFVSRISADERADLLKAFKAANFNELRAAVPRREWATVQAITLLAARYQYVMAEGEAALAPLVQRMRELRLRALSHTHFLLTAGPPQKIAILPWPYADVKLAEFPRVRYSRRCIHLGTVGFPTGGPSRHACPAIFSIASRAARSDGSPGTDPGPRLYFKEGERLFRVTKFPCAADDAGCGTFERLSVQEIHDLDAAVRVQDAEHSSHDSILRSRARGCGGRRRRPGAATRLRDSPRRDGIPVVRRYGPRVWPEFRPAG